MVRHGRDAKEWGRKRPAPSVAVDVDDVVELPVTPGVAWSRLNDVDAVASCLPGLVPDTLRQEGEGRYQATVQAVVFGITAHWAMSARLSPDESTRRLGIELAGSDQRLGLRLEGTVDIEVLPGVEGATQLRYRGHVEVHGRLAAAGGPVITMIAQNMVHRFVESLSGPAIPSGTPEVKGSSPRAAARRLRRR